MATPREQLADILRKSRIDAGYASHGALAHKLNVSRPVITKAENPAHPVPSDAVLAAWAGATGAGLDVLTDMAQRARSGPPGWFAKWADIEARASLIRWFEPLLIPGLFQTESYARMSRASGTWRTGCWRTTSRWPGSRRPESLPARRS
jgi:Domain of unknown function (DUF5753)